MTLTNAEAFAVICSIVGGGLMVAGRLVWSLHRFLVRIDKQLHPNGGSSLADKVNRIERASDQTNLRVGALADSFLEHLVHSERDRQDYTTALAAITRENDK